MFRRMPPIETDRERIAALAEQQRDETAAFRYYVEAIWFGERRSSAELDALVDRIAAGVIPSVDCTACANCCRAMPVGLVPADVTRLARGLSLTPEAVVARMVNRAAGAGNGEWGVMCGPPCPLLRGNLCAAYPHRPGACRQYPFLTPDFLWLMEPILEGAGQCPIIFNVVERLKCALDW
ncbi:MAG: YkgJ family cysteine cluster protein [Chloroflexi bacterium]|nr:YkgJ family cysteine cluster protein [Chloroflexota bacterium]